MSFLDTIVVTCRDASYLHAKQKEGKLSFAESAGLKVHLLYCSLCRLFFKQLDTIEDGARSYAHSEKATPLLDNVAKEKMQEAINRELGN